MSNTLHQRNTIPNSAGTRELKAMNMLKQHKDNFQFGGKDKLNLKLTGCLPQPASFFINLEVFIQLLNLSKIYEI